jgi:hypothetical protein
MDPQVAGAIGMQPTPPKEAIASAILSVIDPGIFRSFNVLFPLKNQHSVSFSRRFLVDKLKVRVVS